MLQFGVAFAVANAGSAAQDLVMKMKLAGAGVLQDHVMVAARTLSIDVIDRARKNATNVRVNTEIRRNAKRKKERNEIKNSRQQRSKSLTSKSSQRSGRFSQRFQAFLPTRLEPTTRCLKSTNASIRPLSSCSHKMNLRRLQPSAR